MGTELRANNNEDMAVHPASHAIDTSNLLRRLPWLDSGTAELLAAIAADLATMHPEVVALILFGSLARHEERPLSHRRPSDVDLLVLVNASAHGDPLPLDVMIALHHTIGEREHMHPVPAHGIQAILTTPELSGWDELFVANVARDGMLLWARAELPKALASVGKRGTVFALDTLTV